MRRLPLLSVPDNQPPNTHLHAKSWTTRGFGKPGTCAPWIHASNFIAAPLVEPRARSGYYKSMKSLLVLAPALCLFLIPSHAQSFPDGPGRSVFENTCGGCQGADI